MRGTLCTATSMALVIAVASVSVVPLNRSAYLHPFGGLLLALLCQITAWHQYVAGSYLHPSKKHVRIPKHTRWVLDELFVQTRLVLRVEEIFWCRLNDICMTTCMIIRIIAYCLCQVVQLCS
jgi:hypothetical protein